MKITVSPKEVKEQAKHLLKLKINLRFLLFALGKAELVKGLPLYQKLDTALRDSLALVENTLSFLVVLEEGANHGE